MCFWICSFIWSSCHGILSCLTWRTWMSFFIFAWCPGALKISFLAGASLLSFKMSINNGAGISWCVQHTWSNGTPNLTLNIKNRDVSHPAKQLMDTQQQTYFSIWWIRVQRLDTRIRFTNEVIFESRLLKFRQLSFRWSETSPDRGWRLSTQMDGHFKGAIKKASQIPLTPLPSFNVLFYTPLQLPFLHTHSLFFREASEIAFVSTQGSFHHFNLTSGNTLSSHLRVILSYAHPYPIWEMVMIITVSYINYFNYSNYKLNVTYFFFRI